MKTDNYLTLCLEQAAKSPLHYRHGAVVVCGGKVIGHGYNDYRPGFNGGALKHGRIAHSSMDGDAVKRLQLKLKKKKQQQDIQQTTSTFTPFEGGSGMGGGHSVHQPLSMHSEMMAIYSALSASSTLSSTTFSHVKPCFKLPSGDKRKARLRRDVLMAYVAVVCETSSSTGKSQPRSEAARNNKSKEDRNHNHNHNHNHNVNKEADEDVDALSRLSKDAGVAFHGMQNGEKHHQNRKNRNHLKTHQNEKKQAQCRYAHELRYGRYGKQTQHAHGQAQAQPSASRSPSSNTTQSHDNDTRRLDNDHHTTHGDDEDTIAASTESLSSHRNVKRKKDYKRLSHARLRYLNQANVLQSGKPRTGPDLDEDGQPSQSLLLPKGRIGERGSVADRKKHPRLQGADLYVARLGWSGKSATKPKKSASVVATDIHPTSTADHPITTNTSSLSNLSATSSHSATGSLHDELINREPSPRPAPPHAAETCGFDRSMVHASRLCYRCITFMHSVGIRRVFWTNDAGEWEGGKIAHLVVESMEGGMGGVAGGGNGGPMGNGVFVTKHEVLMLRRFMGTSGESAKTK